MEKELQKAPWEIIHLLRSNGLLAKKENMDQVHRYLIECCKRIWLLIPDKGSRNGVLAAEQYLNGEIPWEEAMKTDYCSEASAFLFDQRDSTDPYVADHIDSVRNHLESCELLLCPPQKIDNIHELLKEAAYFANEALCYPNIRFGSGHRGNMRHIAKFLPVELFEKTVKSTLYETVL